MSWLIKMEQKLIKFFHNKQQIFTILIITSGLYLLFNLFQIEILIAFFIFFISIYALLFFKWKIVREKGSLFSI
jgi:hypothetical protein